MAITIELLIASPTLQDYFVDKDTGLPLTGGTVTCYQDNSRTTLKNWYYQSGTAGAYEYIALPNPLTLSAVGTIIDANGNDTIPFFYPYSEDDNQTIEPYYITVDNSINTRQFVRQNFPFIVNTLNTKNPTLKNILINNVFWRNNGDMDVTNTFSAVIAPGAHAGFSMADIQFIKDVTGATDTISFLPFPSGDPVGQTLGNDITPEYYLNFKCTAPMNGETIKCIQIPIALHLKTLEDVTATITIQTLNGVGNPNNEIQVYIYQYTGTGQSNSVLVSQGKAVADSTWGKTAFTFDFPSSSGLTLSAAGDDALYLRIQYPLSKTCDISISQPSIYLSDSIPTNDFSSYDEIDAVINTPRTADFRFSLNTFIPGWVPCNDGTIGSSASTATTRANIDTWPLYSLLYDSFSNTLAPVIGGRTTSAIVDFAANKPITLTRVLGRVLAGAGPVGSIAAPVQSITETFTADHTTNLISVSTTTGFITGAPIQCTTTNTLPSPLVPNYPYYMITVDATTFKLASTPENAIAGIPILLTDNGTGVHTIQYNNNPVGTYLGEAFHSLTSGENGQHTHTISGTGTTQVVTTDGPPFNLSVTAGAVGNLEVVSFASVIQPSGFGAGHNTMQPTGFSYIYLKL